MTHRIPFVVTSARAAAAVALASLAAAATGTAYAADPYPNHPIRMIVPFGTGSATDILARILSQKLSDAGIQLVVENRPGAGGSIGTGVLAKAPADGYTLALVSAGHAINATLYPKLPYDTVKDFSAVSLVASIPNVLVVDAASPYKSVKDLLAAASAKPGTINFASAGTGSSTHLSGELLKSLGKVDIVHVPYKGTGEALTDVMAGRVQLMLAPTVSAVPFVEQGRLRALGVTTEKRAAALPNVPTLAEAGVPNYAFDSWFGILAPAGTPRDVIKRLNTEVVKALALPDVKEKLLTLGAEATPSTPEAFDTFIASEVTKLAPVVRQSGASASN